MKSVLVFFSGAALAACSVSDDQMSSAFEGATAAAVAADVEDEYKRTQDFDRIAAESVEGIDTTGFDALGE